LFQRLFYLFIAIRLSLNSLFLISYINKHLIQLLDFLLKLISFSFTLSHILIKFLIQLNSISLKVFYPFIFLILIRVNLRTLQLLSFFILKKKKFNILFKKKKKLFSFFKLKNNYFFLHSLNLDLIN
jgi:hypothetical protein